MFKEGKECRHCTLLCCELEQLLLACSWGLAYATIVSKFMPFSYYVHVHSSIDGDSWEIMLFSEHSINNSCMLATVSRDSDIKHTGTVLILVN